MLRSWSGLKIDPVHNLLLCHSVTKHVQRALNNIPCRIRVDKRTGALTGLPDLLATLVKDFEKTGCERS